MSAIIAVTALLTKVEDAEVVAVFCALTGCIELILWSAFIMEVA